MSTGTFRNGSISNLWGRPDPDHSRSSWAVHDDLSGKFICQPGIRVMPVNVLVIEDSELQSQLIRGMLHTADVDFAVERCDCLHDGLDQLGSESRDWDVVLLDLTLPDSDGVDTCRRVVEHAPDVPLVVLTELNDQDLALAALHSGAQDYLVKSEIDPNLLSRSLRYAIERKQGELELRRARDELEVRVERRTAELRRVQEAARRQQEELAHVARLNTLGEMASGLAHELNQPLMAIASFADTCLQLLEGDNETDRSKLLAALQETAGEAERAGEIIKRMRRLVSKRPPERLPVHLNGLIEETVALLEPGFDVDVSLDLAEDVAEVLADRIQIQQVLLNIAQNALQAMSSAESTRQLTLRTFVDKAAQSVGVEVSDTGPGLPDDDLQRLFDPFFTRSPDGLGLGLSISRTIIDSHAGELTATRNAAGGLTFRFALPQADATRER